MLDLSGRCFLLAVASAARQAVWFVRTTEAGRGAAGFGRSQGFKRIRPVVSTCRSKKRPQQSFRMWFVALRRAHAGGGARGLSRLLPILYPLRCPCHVLFQLVMAAALIDVAGACRMPRSINMPAFIALRPRLGRFWPFGLSREFTAPSPSAFVFGWLAAPLWTMLLLVLSRRLALRAERSRCGPGLALDRI